jgi:hypothetical protein
MKLPRAARKYVDLPVKSYDRDRRELPLLAVQVTTVPAGTPLSPGTLWAETPVVNKKATIFLVGPDAGGPPTGLTVPVVAVPPDGVDLYVRPSDAMESDPVFVDRIMLS